ncbi:hypothetical protein WJX81_000076 [Elliptochloris bilobata]|uniref:Uncharacterized protein n=1 Tax=Elliptochloris bilobata TaxID=381761 RepID=A0AAW1RCL8_9CHLO
MGSLLPGWKDSGLPPKGFRDEDESGSPTFRSNSLRRSSLTRTSTPGLARTSPQPLSPRTPSKSLSAKGTASCCADHWTPGLASVTDDAAAKKAPEEPQPATRWWTKVDSGFFNDKMIEEVPADWKQGSYTPQADVARELAGANPAQGVSQP